jgi:hypothetical protein
MEREFGGALPECGGLAIPSRSCIWMACVNAKMWVSLLFLRGEGALHGIEGIGRLGGNVVHAVRGVGRKGNLL